MEQPVSTADKRHISLLELPQDVLQAVCQQLFHVRSSTELAVDRLQTARDRYKCPCRLATLRDLHHAIAPAETWSVVLLYGNAYWLPGLARTRYTSAA